MNEQSSLLYIHVPFCRSKCRYCAFFSQPVGFRDNAFEATYIRTVCEELRLAGQNRRPIIETIFFGGGTPSILSIEAIQSIFQAIYTHFEIASDAEISFEANPESISDKSKLSFLRKCGVNRLSIGVQSMNDDELALLGRIHSVRDVIRAMYMARQAGFDNINLDLMWGLPHQSITDLKNNLSRTIELSPNHISAYGLTIEDGTPLAKDISNGTISIPSEEMQSEMYMITGEMLESAGFMQYEISNYAKMGYECRHNLGYWCGKNYYGVGPSAVSCINHHRYTNPSDITAWQNAVNSGIMCVEDEVLDTKAQAEEFVMLSLRTVLGLDTEKYIQRFGYDILHGRELLVKKLCENGLINFDGRILKLTRKGMLISNSIISSFFD